MKTKVSVNDLFLISYICSVKGTFTFCLLSCRVTTYVVFLGWNVNYTSNVPCLIGTVAILSRWFERANIFYRQSHGFASFQHSSKMESGCLCSGTNNGSIWTWVGVVAKWVFLTLFFSILFNVVYINSFWPPSLSSSIFSDNLEVVLSLSLDTRWQLRAVCCSSLWCCR